MGRGARFGRHGSWEAAAPPGWRQPARLATWKPGSRLGCYRRCVIELSVLLRFQPRSTAVGAPAGTPAERSAKAALSDSRAALQFDEIVGIDAYSALLGRSGAPWRR